MIVKKSLLCLLQGVGTVRGRAEAGQHLVGCGLWRGPYVDLGRALEAKRQAMPGVFKEIQGLTSGYYG